MKSLISILFLLIFVCSAVRSYLPYADYIINYDYIVEELCENKEKPKLECAGKCFLAKELVKYSEDTKKTKKRNTKKTKVEHNYFSNTIEELVFNKIVFKNTKVSTYYTTSNESVFNELESPPPKYS